MGLKGQHETNKKVFLYVSTLRPVQGPFWVGLGFGVFVVVVVAVLFVCLFVFW